MGSIGDREGARAESERIATASVAVAPAEAAGAVAAVAGSRPSSAQVLALQRLVGNAATARLLSRQPLTKPPVPAHDTDDDDGDGDDDDDNVEWMIPPTKGSGELVALMHEIRDVNAKHLGHPELMKQTSYLVLSGGMLLHCGPDQRQIGSYQVKRGVTTVPPGYWAGSVPENIWRRLSHRKDPPGPWGFNTWQFNTARTPLPDWLTDADNKRFTANLNSVATPSFMLAVPGGSRSDAGGDATTPGWGDKQAAAAQKLADAARAAAGAGKGADKTKAVTDPALKKIPDRLVAWSKGEKTYVNVWADGAHTTLELNEGETPEQLLERAKEATERLRESRDASTSFGVEGAKDAIDKSQKGAKPPPGNYREDYDPDPNRPPMPNKGANLPPYPATVTMAGSDPAKPETAITVPGASNQFKINVDWSRGGRDQNLLSLVTAQMQYIAYRWELIKVTPGDYARQANDARRAQIEEQQKEAAKVEGGKGEDTLKHLGPFAISSGEAADISRAFKNIGEDTKADLKDMSEMPWPLRQQYLQVIGISVAVRAIGSLVSEFVTRITMPLDERKISFGGPGDYIVRCIATPLHDDDAAYIRASSVATYAVRVETTQDRAHLADEENDRELAALNEQLKNPPKDKTVDQIKSEIEERKRQASATHLENTEHYLKQARDDLKLAQDLKIDVDAGRKGPVIGRDDYSLKKRWLAVQLAQSKIGMDDYLEQSQKLVTNLEQTEGRLKGYGLEGVKGSAYSPRVTLASEENGQTYQLLTVLGQTKTMEDDGRVEYRLADVTSQGHQQQYKGSSAKAGPEGHQEAIRNAFVNFRENNGYGRGAIVIRLPASLENDPAIGPLPMEREMRSAPGEHARAMQKLKDVATAAAVAGLVVGGPAGMAIGIVGGAATLVLTIEGIRERVSGGRFELLSFDTLMDVINIVGSTVGIGAGVSGMARAGGSAARWAVTAERLFVPIMKGQLALQVVILPASAYIQLAKLDEEIKNSHPPMTEGEIALRRAEIATSFAWGAFTTTVSAAQMMGMPSLIGGHAPGAPLDEGIPGQGEHGSGRDDPSLRPGDHGSAPPDHGSTPPDEHAPAPSEEHGQPPPDHADPQGAKRPTAEQEAAAEKVRGQEAQDAIVAEKSLINAHGEPHEIHRSKDGSIRRCSWACMLLVDNVRERAAALEAGFGDNSIYTRDARALIERANRLQKRSTDAAAKQATREARIDTLPEGSPRRSISEAALAKWLEGRNRVFNNEAAEIEVAMSKLEERAGIQTKPDQPASPAKLDLPRLINDFTDVAHEPAFKDDLNELEEMSRDPAREGEFRTKLDALAARMRAHVEANIPQAIAAARKARGMMPVGSSGPRGGCLAKSGDLATTTESGWKDYRDPGISQATDMVLDNVHDMHYDLPTHEYDDATPGHVYASHAEKQLNALRPGEPIGVSLPMCFDCYNFFRARANSMGRPLVVADPEITRVFHPDGRVEVAPGVVAPPATGPTNQNIGTPGAGASPK